MTAFAGKCRRVAGFYVEIDDPPLGLVTSESDRPERDGHRLHLGQAAAKSLRHGLLPRPTSVERDLIKTGGNPICQFIRVEHEVRHASFDRFSELDIDPDGLLRHGEQSPPTSMAEVELRSASKERFSMSTVADNDVSRWCGDYVGQDVTHPSTTDDEAIAVARMREPIGAVSLTGCQDGSIMIAAGIHIVQTPGP